MRNHMFMPRLISGSAGLTVKDLKSEIDSDKDATRRRLRRRLNSVTALFFLIPLVAIVVVVFMTSRQPGPSFLRGIFFVVYGFCASIVVLIAYWFLNVYYEGFCYRGDIHSASDEIMVNKCTKLAKSILEKRR